MKQSNTTKLTSALLGGMILAAASLQAQPGPTLPDPDQKEADMSQKVRVFIIMGQSNTLEMGKVKSGEGSLLHAVTEEGLYPFMVDDKGTWTVRKDVRNVSVMQKRGNMDVYRNDWLTVSGGKIGIEQGIGHHMGNAIDAPVMILKSSIGNRALGWDLLPPGSVRFEHEGFTYPGYKDEARHGKWPSTAEPPPNKGDWYAGIQYDWDVANAKTILENIDQYYPGAKGYEVAGFFWWQGNRDKGDPGHSARYGENLKTLIRALRKDFAAPDAKFVCATLGETQQESASGNEKLMLDGKMNLVNDAEFKGHVATVYSHPLMVTPSHSGAHYNGDARTYMNVGLAMGEAMVELIK